MSYRYLGNSAWQQTQLGCACRHCVCSGQGVSLLVRRIKAFGTNSRLHLLFYRATIESVIRYGITSSYGSLSIQVKLQLLSSPSKIVGCTLSPSVQEIFEHTSLASKIDLLLRYSDLDFTWNINCFPQVDVTKPQNANPITVKVLFRSIFKQLNRQIRVSELMHSQHPGTHRQINCWL